MLCIDYNSNRLSNKVGDNEEDVDDVILYTEDISNDTPRRKEWKKRNIV